MSIKKMIIYMLSMTCFFNIIIGSEEVIEPPIESIIPPENNVELVENSKFYRSRTTNSLYLFITWVWMIYGVICFTVCSVSGLMPGAV